MLTLAQLCPHCNTENTGFTAEISIQPDSTIRHFLIPFVCNSCSQMVVADVSSPWDPTRRYKGNIANWPDIKVNKIYPQPLVASPLPHLPDKIQSVYLQAKNSVFRKCPDAAGAMARKTLEMTCKHIDGSYNGTLFKHIDYLHSKGLITKDLKEWAHTIRLEGNNAAHGEALISEEDSEDILNFTEMFLMYTISMPEMVRLKRNATP